MKIARLAATAACCLSLGACATVIKGSSESVAITTPPTTGATCNLTSSQGTWTVVTPGVATVQRSKDNVAIHCTKPGWQDAAAVIPSTFNGWTLGNILIGGLIGAGVDAATGADNDYPNAFQVPMTKVEGAVDTPSPAPTPHTGNKTVPTS